MLSDINYLNMQLQFMINIYYLKMQIQIKLNFLIS